MRLRGYILVGLGLFFWSCGVLNKGSKSQSNVEVDALTERQRLQADLLFFDAIKEKSLDNPKKAIGLFQECLRIDESNHAVMHELASLYLGNNDLDNALMYEKNAIELAPDNKWYLLKLAEIYNQSGDYVNEANTYESLIEIDDQNPEWHYNLANAYIQAKEWKKAISAYNTIERYMGLNEEITFQKQKLYLQLNDQKSAVAEIQKLIDSKPNEPRYYGMMAELYMVNNQPDIALQYIDDLLEIDENNGLALFSKALFLQETGDYEQSYIYLKKAFANQDVEQSKKIEVLLSFYDLSAQNLDMQTKAFELCDIMEETHPDNARFFEIHGKFLYRAKQNIKAYNAFKKATELNPGAWPNWAILMEISAVENRNLILDQDATKAMDLFPEQGLGYYFGGYAKYRLKQYKEAVEILDRGQYFTSDPSIKSEMNFFLGLASLELEDFDKAYKAYDKALNINPNYSGVLNSYAYSLALRKMELDKAEKMSSKSLELDPENAAFLDTYAWVLYQMEDYQGALDWINKAIEASSKQPSGEIFEHKGDILFRMGNTNQAMELWKEAAKYEDASDGIQQKISTGKLDE